MRSILRPAIWVLVSASVVGAWLLLVGHGARDAEPASAAVAQMEAALAEKDAAIAALQQQVARLERNQQELDAAAPVLRAPAATPESPAATAAAEQQVKQLPVAPAPIPATEPELAALAWLRGLLPDKFGALTPEAMRALTDLNLRGAAVTDLDLQHLAALPNLEILQLRGTKVAGPGLANVPVNLHHVDLTDSRVDEVGLQSLPPLPRLATLKLNRLPVTDDSLEMLPRWPQLRHLEVDGTRISERGVRRVLDLLPRVTRIEARGLAVSPELVAHLRTRHPGVELVDESVMRALERQRQGR